MNYELVIGKSKILEGLLRDRGFDGRGLHELVTNAGTEISEPVARSCRKVATIRNKHMHDPNFRFTLDEQSAFIQAAEFAIDHLKTQTKPKQSNPWNLGISSDRFGSNTTPSSEPFRNVGANANPTSAYFTADSSPQTATVCSEVPPASGHNNGPAFNDRPNLNDDKSALKEKLFGYGLGALALAAYGGFKIWLEIRD